MTIRNNANIFCSLLFAASALFSQTMAAQTTGTLNGKIVGPDGRPVPSASVIVTGTSGATQNAVTAADGTYAVTNLPPGPYRVDVQMSGFKSISQNNVQVDVNTPASMNLTLETGNPVEKVQVQGEVPIVQDENATVNRTYSSAVLTDLPIEDLNTQQLAEKMPGVSPPVVSKSLLIDPQANRVWSTNGQQPLANDVLLDGIQNFEPVNGTAVHVPAVNALQEMNVATSNYGAADGRAAGSVLDQVGRGGTNQFHGNLFELNSNDWFRARNYFDPQGFAQSRYELNQFGGVFGGPVVRNKTFFFLSYEGDYLRDQNPTFATVPTTDFASGNFSVAPFPIVNPNTGLPFPGNRIPLSQQNLSAQLLTSALPLPNVTGYEYNYFANVPFQNDGNRVDARIDEHFTNSTSMALRYGLSYYNTRQQAIFPGISADGGTSRLRAHDAITSVQHIFNPQVSTTFQLGFTRYSDPISALGSPFNGNSFGFSGADGGIPYVQIAGMPALGENPNYPQLNKENTYSYRNTWRAHLGIHEVTWGEDFWMVRFDGFQNLAYGPAGAYIFSPGATSVPGSTSFGEFANAYAGFLLGAPTTSGVISNAFVPSYISYQLGGFVSDRIRLTSRLTVDLGVRYDRFFPVYPRANEANYSIFSPATDTLTTLGAGATKFGDLHGHNLNFAPRVGLAYRATEHMVVRAGYGMSYWDPIQYEASALIPAFTGVANGVAGGYGVAPGGFGVVPAPVSSGAAPNTPLYYTDGTFKTPYVQFYNFTVQNDLGHGMLADIGYVGNVSRDLPYTQNVNAALPGTGAAGLPFGVDGRTADTFLRGTGYSSNYNAFQFNLTKRFSEGLAFSIAYTWSKADDYGAGLAPFLNNVNPIANFGPSDFDRTNVLTLTHNWRIPIGTGTSHMGDGLIGHLLGPWQLDGVLTFGTGLPYTPVADSSVCGCPGNTPTANLIPGAGGSSVASIPGYLGLYSSLVPTTLGVGNFTQPNGTFGDLGRNSFRGPNYANYDLALTRSLLFLERARIDFRVEAYNLTNSSHFTNPFSNVNAVNFGQPFATAYGLGPRTLQLALKLIF